MSTKPASATAATPAATLHAQTNAMTDYSWEARVAARLSTQLKDSGLASGQTIQEILAQAKFELLGEFLEGLSVEEAAYSYNRANDYGSITVTLFTGQGDPSVRFKGKPCLTETAKGIGQSYDVVLPASLAPVLWERSAAARKRQAELQARLQSK